MFIKFLKKIICFYLVFAYVWLALDAPLQAYALANYNSVRLGDINLPSSNTIPFSTKTHIVIETDTITNLCARYNISKTGFLALNKEYSNTDLDKPLEVGSTLIVPTQPLSKAMSNYLDGNQDLVNLISESISKTTNILKNNRPGFKKQAIKGEVINQTNEVLNSKITNFLGQYATIQLNIDANDKFSFANSQFNMLLPLYDKGRYLLFTQLTYHKSENNSSIGNLGVGGRYFDKQYMIGANAFLDYDFTRNLTRFGLGGEYARNYLKASANIYLGQSTWLNSHDFFSHLERPASGWDIRLQGYLPSKPQLGGKVIFEQYYGKDVALFGEDNLQKDPYALTLGVDYTPVPLLNFNVDYKRGKNSKQQTHLGLNLSYRMGMSLADQMNPENVAKLHSLQGSRYDLVDRNNDMVLEYKKDNVLTIDAPEKLSIKALSPFNSEPAPVTASDTNKYQIKYLNNMLYFRFFVNSKTYLDDSLNCNFEPNAAYTMAGGSINLLSKNINGKQAVYNLRLLPPNESSLTNNFGPFKITIIVTDKSGHSASKIITLEVQKNPHPNIKLLVNPITVAVGVLNKDGKEIATPTQIVLKYKKQKDKPLLEKVCFVLQKEGEPLKTDYCKNLPARDDWRAAGKGISIYQNPQGSQGNYVSALLANSDALKADENTALYKIVPIIGEKPYEYAAQDLTIVRTDNSRPNIEQSKLLLQPHSIINDNKDHIDISYIANNISGSLISNLEKSLKFEVQDRAGQIISKNDVKLSVIKKITTNGNVSYTSTISGSKAGEYRLAVYYKSTIIASDKFSIIDNTLFKDAQFTLSLSKIVAYNVANKNENSETTAKLTFKGKHKLDPFIKSLKLKVKEPYDNSLLLGDFKLSRDGYTAVIKGKQAGQYLVSATLGGNIIANTRAQNLEVVVPTNRLNFDKKNSSLKITPEILNNKDFVNGKTPKLSLKPVLLSGIIDLNKLKFVITKGDKKTIKIAPIKYDKKYGIYTADVSAADNNINIANYSFGVVYNKAILKFLNADLHIINDAQSSFDILNKEHKVYADEPISAILKLKSESGKAITNAAKNINFDITDESGHKIKPSAFNIHIVEQNGTYSVIFHTKKAGIYNIKAKYNNNYISDKLNSSITVLADDRDPKTFNSSITLSPKIIVDSGHEYSTLTLILKDKYGNNLESKDTNLSIATKNKTNLNRIWIKEPFEPKTSGIYTVKLAGIGLSSELDVTVLYNKATIGSSENYVHLCLIDSDNAPYSPNCYFTVSTEKLLVGSEKAKISFTAINLYGKPLSNLDKNLQFVALDKNGKKLNSDICQITDIINKKNGVYEATIIGKKEVVAKIQPQFNKVQIGSFESLITIYITDKIDRDSSIITSNKKAIKANNKDFAILTYKPYTKLHKPMIGLKNLVFKSKLKTNNLLKAQNAPVNISDYMSAINEIKPGIYQIKIKGSLAGKYDVWATQNDLEVSKNHIILTMLPDISIIPDNATFNIKGSTVKDNIPCIIADGADKALVTIKISYKHQIMSGYAAFLNIVASSSKGLAISKVTENKERPGIYIADVTGITNGKYNLTLTYNKKHLKAARLYVSSDKTKVSEKESEVKGVDDITEAGITPALLTLALKDEHHNIKGNIDPKKIYFIYDKKGINIDPKPEIHNQEGTYIFKVYGKKAGSYDIGIKIDNVQFNTKKAHVKVLSDMPVKPSRLDCEGSIQAGDKLKITLAPVVREDGSPITDDISKFLILKSEKNSFNFTKENKTYITEYSSARAGSHTLKLYYKLPDSNEVDTNISTEVTVTPNKNPPDEAESTITGVDDITENNITQNVLVLTLKDKNGFSLGAINPDDIHLIFKDSNSNLVQDGIINHTPPPINEATGTYTYQISSKKADEYDIYVKIGAVEFKNKHAHVKVLSDMPGQGSTFEKPSSVELDKTAQITLTAYRENNDPILDDISRMIVLKEGNKEYPFNLQNKKLTASFSSRTAGKHTFKLYYKPLWNNQEIDTKLTTDILVIDPDIVPAKVVPEVHADNLTESGLTKGSLFLKFYNKNNNPINVDKKTIKFDIKDSNKYDVTASALKIVSVNDKEPGRYDYSITSDNADTYSVKIKLNGKIIPTTAIITVLSNMPQGKSQLTATPAKINVGETSIITLTPVERENHSEITEDLTKLLILKENKNNILHFVKSEDGKSYTTKYTAPENAAGSHNFSLMYLKNKYFISTGITVMIKINAGGVDSDNSSVTQDSSSLTDNGKTFSTLVVTLGDSNGAAVTDLRENDFVFNITPKNKESTLPDIKDVFFLNLFKTKNNEYTFKVTSVFANTYTVQVTARGVIIGSQDYTVNSDCPAPDQSSFIPATQDYTFVNLPIHLKFNVINSDNITINDNIADHLSLYKDNNLLGGCVFKKVSGNDAQYIVTYTPTEHGVQNLYVHFTPYYKKAKPIICSKKLPITVYGDLSSNLSMIQLDDTSLYDDEKNCSVTLKLKDKYGTIVSKILQDDIKTKLLTSTKNKLKNDELIINNKNNSNGYEYVLSATKAGDYYIQFIVHGVTIEKMVTVHHKSSIK